MDPSQPEISFRSLGTDIYLQIVTTDERDRSMASRDMADVKRIYFAAEKIFSRFDSESELSRLNRSLGKFIRVSPELLYGIKKSIEYYSLTNGFFEPRILDRLESIGYRKDFDHKDRFAPSKIKNKCVNEQNKLDDDIQVSGNRILLKRRIDLSGLVKGLVNDTVAGLIRKQGWKNFLVDSGGDLFVAGLNEYGHPWKIDIEGLPIDKGVLTLSEAAIATSGITRRQWRIDKKRYHHLINPHKIDYFSFELSSVTVVSATTELADVFAKVLFLMGEKVGLEFAELHKIAALFLNKHKEAVCSTTMEKYLQA